MPQPCKPRCGSMEFWPRKRARRIYARVRSWPKIKEAIPLGFAGYKAGMTHIILTDNRKHSKTKGEPISSPVTVIECPPIKIASVLFYKYDVNKWLLKKEVMVKCDKELARRIMLPKKFHNMDDITLWDYDDVRIKVYTQPKLTGIGEKKPELFEIALGGTKEEKFKYIKEHIGKEINIRDIFREGQQLDFHAVTKGKGNQGPVKRFGLSLRSHKSEKTKRGPGSLGAWCAQGHIMYRVAHLGKMGFHTRTDYNKWLIKISNKPEEINPKDGFVRYGIVKNDYILVKGSVSGPQKRVVRFNFATRPNHIIPSEAPAIEYTSLRSKQGR